MSTPVYRYKLTVAGQDHLFGDLSGRLRSCPSQPLILACGP
ncbi:hypothetical protein ACIRVF_33745 [Kitasatospora sp. NPDC101157]